MRATRAGFGRWSCLITASALLVAAPWARAGGALDARTFVVETGEKGKPRAETDAISFTDGRFRSKACDAYGFGSAPYKTVAKDGAATFEAETTSAKEGRIRWRGTVKGDVVEGSYVWSKAGQADIEYWFKGSMKKQAP